MPEYDGRYGTLDDWQQFGRDADYHRQPALQFEDAIAREGISAYVAAHGPLSERNASRVLSWVKAHLVPATRNNLEIAVRVLTAEAQLERETPVQKLMQKEMEIRPVVAAQTAEPTAEEKATLEKVKDDPNLSDHQRKLRDKKLKQAATAQRIGNRKISIGGTAPV